MLMFVVMVLLSLLAAVLAWQLVLRTLPSAIRRFNEGERQ